jgi:SAF domain-containing protein
MSKESPRVADVAVQDRQRDREARGVRSRNGSSAYSTNRPSPPRRRRPGLAALAVLLIIGGAAIAGSLALRLDSREPVLVLNQDVAVGTKITASMLSTTNVASDKLMLIPEDQASSVIGTYARTSLTRGELVDTSMLLRGAPFGSDVVQVGMPLSKGKVPSDLRAGDEVRIVRISDGNNPPQALALGIILSTSTASSGGSLGGDSSSASAMVLVPVAASDAVVDAAGNDAVGVSLVKRGVSAADADLRSLIPVS